MLADELDGAEDDYARLCEHPIRPALWIDLGRRLGELQRWDEAAKAFAKAAAYEADKRT